MDDTTRDLNVKCPECYSNLYAYYHEAVSGDECTGTWNVECEKCDYVPEDHCFANLDSISEHFSISTCICGTDDYSKPKREHGLWVCGKCRKPY